MAGMSVLLPVPAAAAPLSPGIVAGVGTFALVVAALLVAAILWYGRRLREATKRAESFKSLVENQQSELAGC